MNTVTNVQFDSKNAVLRRSVVLAGLSTTWLGRSHAVDAGALVFPRDHGSHLDAQTEWWYVTGSVSAGASRFGFQVTFFRSRVAAAQSLKSALAAKHLLFAHAAVTDLQRKVLLHGERIARWDGAWVIGANGQRSVVGASPTDTDVAIRDWQLRRDERTGYTTQVRTDEFSLALSLVETQALLLQGVAGLSRKGPDERQVSRYYSKPQLKVSGELGLGGKTVAVQGHAWLDHEWSDEILHPDAVGWDWIGMNLLDGSSLTAFQLRKSNGQALWSGGSERRSSGPARIAANGDMVFTPSSDPAKRFKSPKTGATYPIEWQVRTPSNTYTVRALLADQELDSRSSTGTVYWEGLCELLTSSGQVVGRGYLEMTGYAGRIRL